jgi:sugar fermentation stimulation protein A
MPVKPDGESFEARFVERPNRFVVVAEREGEHVRAHCPNPGRLTEMLHEGNPFLVRERPDADPDQATSHSVVAARDPRFHVDSGLELGDKPEDATLGAGAWVLLDTSIANRLVADALDRGELAELAEGQAEVAYRTEPQVEHGRFDVAIAEDEAERMVEVKSVTLIGEDGTTGLFPDAPTTRGVRHVKALTERARQGEPATLLFVAYRTDAERVAPNAVTDPDFARALRAAREAGVELRARSLEMGSEWSFALGDPIPVVDVADVDVGGEIGG